MTAFLPRLPNLVGFGTRKIQPGVTTPVHAADGNHCTFPSAAGALPVGTGPTISGCIVRLGLPLYVVLLVTIVTGFPVCSCRMPASSHPAISRLPWNGRS